MCVGCVLSRELGEHKHALGAVEVLAVVLHVAALSVTGTAHLTTALHSSLVK